MTSVLSLSRTCSKTARQMRCPVLMLSA
jgi:hypothetical protein